MSPLDLPLFVPVMLLVAVGAVRGAGWFGRATGAPKRLGVLLIVAFGIVAAATLTPQAGAFRGELGSGTCDLGRLQPADLRAYLKLGETLGNVLLFVPLGIALALLPASRARRWLLALAISLPFVVEGVQRTLPALDRACQGADVVDNLLGLGIGLALGMLARWVVRRGRQPSQPGPEEVDGPASEPRPPS